MQRLGSFAVGVALFAVAGVATAKEVWRDPGVFEQNRLPARSIMVPCESAKTALAVAKGEKPRTESKWLQSLNGDWGFKWKHDFYAKEWEKTAKIAVPGCWQLQGEYDPALYTNATYPIHGWNEGDPYVEPPKDYTSVLDPRRLEGPSRRHPLRRRVVGDVPPRQRQGSRIFAGQPPSGRVRHHAVPEGRRERARGRGPEALRRLFP